MKLPKGWKVLSLGAVLGQPESGVSVLCDDGEPNSDEPGVLKLSCVTGGRFNPNDRKKPMANEVPRLTTFAKRNTILISRSNTPALVGASAYVKEDALFAFLPDTLWMLHPKDSDVSMKWLSCLLLSDEHRLALRQIASGTSDSMKKIQKGALLKLKVAVPTLPEQHKIAEILGTWDDGLAKLDALIAAKERRKKGLMHQLLTGKRRVKGGAGHIPTHLRASALFATRSERNVDSHPALSVTQDQGVLLQSDLDRRIQHDANNLQGYKVAYFGDFIISLRSFEGGLEYTTMTGAISPAYHVIYPIVEVETAYYKHYFKSPNFIGLLATAVIGIRDGKQVSLDDFMLLSLPCPCISEQRAIADIFDACDDELRLLRAQRGALDQQKRGLMQRLLMGKIRVNTDGQGRE